MRGDSLQEFNRVEGEASLAPVVELEQANNPVLVPNGDQGNGSIAVMHALIARMIPRISFGRDIQNGERIVRPKALSAREERIGRVRLAGNDEATSAFQPDLAFFVPAHRACGITFEQSIFRQQKASGETLLRKVREVIPFLEAHAY